MCGIAGFFGPGDATLLQAMAAAIVHRGPDGGGHIVVGPAGLAMRRLAIIDLAGGQQPMADERGRVQLVFNGELYNYRELRARFLADAEFRTASDTEVVLRMYLALGEAAFQHFNGMFAIALYDTTLQRLYLVRDRLGVKPLYYYQGPTRLTFASELKALLQDPQVPRQLDPGSLAAFLDWQYVPGPATMLAGVHKLPAGHWLALEVDKAPVLQTYWRPETVALSPPSDLRELPERLRAAVHRQMVSDVPVGAFLSGGLDSSLVVALMRERAGAGLKTFTAGFDAAGYDESAWAATAARHLGVAHEVVRLDASALELLPSLAYSLDEPIADRAALPTLVLARVAAREVKVVLTGEGSDELFGGYPRYRLETWARRFHQLPLSDRRALWALVVAGMPVGLRRRLAKVVLSSPDAGRRREEWVGTFSRDARAALLVHAAEVMPPRPVDGSLRAQLLLDLRTWLVDDVLMKVDKTTMAASLEARVPFLDHDLVEWALALPDRDKLRGETTKFAVKQAAQSVLPAALIHRPKQGFQPPTAGWLRMPKGIALLHDVLRGGAARDRGLFHPAEVERLIGRHAAGEDLDLGLWSLLILELWLQAYLDRIPVSPSSPAPAV